MLEDFEINSRMKKGYGKKRNVFALVIGKKDERQRFARRIGFLSSKKNMKMMSSIPAKDECMVI